MVPRLNPVLLPEGRHQDTEDEFVFGHFPEFTITRATDTGQDWCSPLGPMHRTNLDSFIEDDGEGFYDYVDLGGLPVSFAHPDPTSGGRETNESSKHLALEVLPDATLRLHDSRVRSVTTFERFAGTSWHPVAFQDESDFTTTIDRSKEGWIESVRHPSGVTLQFQNDQDGRRLGYDVVGLDRQTLAVMRYLFDDQGRLTSAVTPYGKNWTWSYGEQSLTSSDGAYTRTTHRFDERGRTEAVDTGGAYRQGRIEYFDALDHVTVHFGAGDRDGFEMLWFDSDQREIMSANPLGEISRKEYDDEHQLIAEIDPNGDALQYRYDGLGNLTSVTDAEGRAWSETFDDRSNVLAREDAAGNAWNYRYDDAGRLVEITDPLGQLTNIINDEAGLPLQVMRHDGLIEFRSYDAHRRLTSVIDFNSAETRFAYDEFNRLVEILDASGGVTRLIYDEIAGRPFDTPSRIVKPDGVEIRRAFGPSGAVESVVDGEGRETQYKYGPYDVLEGIIDPKGNSLRFAYDSKERLTGVTNQLGLVWSFERDGAGRVVRETDFDGRVLTYAYDPGGRVIRRGNPDGSHLEYDYDKSGLPTEMRAFEADNPNPVATTFAYDQNGELIEAANPDAKILLERDALGQVVAETVNGARIESEIDCCGRRTRRTIGDQIVEMAYDGMGGLTQWQLSGHEPIRFERNAFGLETRRATRPGFELTQGWDALGQMQWQTGKGFGRSYAWSRAYDPVAINDAIWGEKHYRYDQNGQISQTHHGDGRTERFGYNDDLNLAASGDAERFLNWETSAAGVVKLAHGPRGEVVKLEHDVCGRVVKRRVERNGFRPQIWTFDWNAQDQMIAAHCPDGRTWTYAYDPFGRRISKETRDERHEFVWDGDVIACEIRNGRKIDWFFEHDSFRPMARCEDGKLWHIVNDHLGTPKEMVSEDGSLIWAADHDTWGSVRRHWRPDRGASATAAAYDIWSYVDEDRDYSPEEYTLLCPIRFQGQWEDAETGFYYNRFRYFCPVTALFIAIDPIGLLGGTNQHSYTLNPATFVDPFGLDPHHATWLLRDRTGGVIAEGTSRSGSMVRPGRRLTFPEQLDTHTEAKILNKLSDRVQPGQRIEIFGTKPPCNPGGRGCQWRMSEFSKKHGVQIDYHDRTNNKVHRFRPEGPPTVTGCCSG